MKISNASQARPPTHKATTKAANRCCRVYPSMVPIQFESSLRNGQTDHPPISMDGFSSTWVGSMLTTQCPFWACKQTLSRVRAISVYPRSRAVRSGRRVRTDYGGPVEPVSALPTPPSKQLAARQQTHRRRPIQLGRIVLACAAVRPAIEQVWAKSPPLNLNTFRHRPPNFTAGAERHFTAKDGRLGQVFELLCQHARSPANSRIAERCGRSSALRQRRRACPARLMRAGGPLFDEHLAEGTTHEDALTALLHWLGGSFPGVPTDRSGASCRSWWCDFARSSVCQPECSPENASLRPSRNMPSKSCPSPMR